MKKLIDLKLTIDPVTGEAKYLNELNALGRRKPKDPCPKEKKASKSKQNNIICECLCHFLKLLTYLLKKKKKL